MSEDASASEAVARADGFRRLSGALAPAAVGLLALVGFEQSPAGSLSGTMLTAAGAGLIVFSGVVLILRRPILNPGDYYGGLALLAIALFALWAGGDLPGSKGISFGPGTAPRMFGVVLALLSAAVMLTGAFVAGPKVERYDITPSLLIIVSVLFNQLGQNFTIRVVVAGAAFALGCCLALVKLMRPDNQYVRGPLFITLGVVFFALTVRQFGLVVTSYVTIVLSAFASAEVRWLETLIWAAVMTAFCAVLFPVALSLPLPLWPMNVDLSALINLK